VQRFTLTPTAASVAVKVGMKEFIKQQDDLIKNTTSRGALFLKVVKLILSLLKSNLKNRQSINKNYSWFTKKISKIDICTDRLLEVANHYNDQVSSKNEELKKLILRFSKMKADIQKKFSVLFKSLALKKKEVDAARWEYSKIEKLKDDFILKRYLASHRASMHEKEIKFERELLDQTREVMDLDSQILLEFDKILNEIDKKKVSSISGWNPLESYNHKALEEHFINIPVVKQHVTEKIGFSDKKCSKMQLYTIFGDKVYCFSVVKGGNVDKMSQKYNFRPELQTLAQSDKDNVSYFESKTPDFTTSVSKVDLLSVGMNASIKIKFPSSKWYKKTDTRTVCFRDYDEMSEFMDAFGLQVPSKIMGKRKENHEVEAPKVEAPKVEAPKVEAPKVEKVKSSKDEKKDSPSAEFENESLSQETKEGRIREDSQATLQNEIVA
jgi:hypothetical protein